MTIPESPYGPSSVATPPAPVPLDPPRRGLGTASLVLSLVPVALALIFLVIVIVAGATDDTGWAILGWAILGAYVVAPAAIILGGLAIGLGIPAVVKRRGRGLGIVGIVVGGLDVVAVLAIVLSILFGAVL